MSAKYTTDPKEIYTLELEKLQRCFNELMQVGEAVSAPPKIGWRQVEWVRQFQFLLQEAIQVGEVLTGAGKLPY
jgi:hypothetical protein